MQNSSLNKPVSNRICVLYDPADGRVVHGHRVLTMPGGQEITDEEVENSARERATQVGHDASGLIALRVTPEDCDCASQYRVDLVTKKLHKLERPPARR